MSGINQHHFDVKLPMFPHQTIGEKDMPCEIKMDGNDVRATDITIRAGANGFTNVVIGIEASIAAEFDAHLVANIENADHQDMALRLANVYYVAHREVYEELNLHGDGDEPDFNAKAAIVRRILTLIMERI